MPEQSAPSYDKTVIRWPRGADPVALSQMWVAERLYPWQARVLTACTQRGAGVATVTPNESGKTAVVLPCLGLGFMAAFPGAQVVSTAGVERQITGQLWPVLRATLARYPRWSITDDLRIRAPAIRGLPPSTWTGFTTKDPEYAEGFHARWYRDEEGTLVYAPLCMIIDEAKSFDDPEFFTAFERCDPDVWLVASTPGEDTGPFFDCFNKGRGRPWDCQEITWDDCPHLRIGRKLRIRQQRIERDGINDPRVQSMIFGKFTRKGTHLVFERMELVRFAMSGMVEEIPGERTAAIDLSGGGDEQVIGIREGNRMLEMLGFHIHDATRLGDELVRVLRRWEIPPENTIADSGGLGAAVIDYMERIGHRGIRRYRANEPARNQVEYKNRAAEDHFKVRRLVDERAVGLVDDRDLEDQMRRRRYDLPNDDSNRIRVEPKEKLRNRGEGSPDRLDTVVMLYSDLPPIETLRRRGRGGAVSRCGRIEDCWRATGGDAESVFAEQRFDQ